MALIHPVPLWDTFVVEAETNRMLMNEVRGSHLFTVRREVLRFRDVKSGFLWEVLCLQ